jgi:hypothetical protein
LSEEAKSIFVHFMEETGTVVFAAVLNQSLTREPKIFVALKISAV